MEIKKLVVHDFDDKATTFSVFENMISKSKSAPQLHSEDAYGVDRAGEDDSDAFCSEDVNMNRPASADTSAASAGTESIVQVIQIPTENSALQDDCDPCSIKVRLTTPVIRVHNVDDGARTCLQSLDVEDDDSNAVVRVTWECGSEVKTTMMTPVSDLVSECLDLAEAQVEAVPLDQQFYNQWARHPREKDPDRDLASGARRPISLRMLPATGSLKSYSLLNAIVRDKTSPIDSYGNLNQNFKTSSSSLPTVAGGAGGSSHPSNGRLSPSAGRRSSSGGGGGGGIAPAPPQLSSSSILHRVSSSAYAAAPLTFRCSGQSVGTSTMWEPQSSADSKRSGTADEASCASEASPSSSSSASVAESRRRRRLRRAAESGDDPPLFAADDGASGHASSSGGDVRFFLESLDDASDCDQEAPENLFVGGGEEGGGGSGEGGEPVACYAMPRRCRSWICTAGFPLPPSTAPPPEMQRQQPPLLPLNMASLLFSQDIDMRDNRYRYAAQFGNKRQVPPPIGIAKPFKPRDAISGSGPPQAKGRDSSSSSKGKDGNGGSSASGGATDKPEVTNVEFIDLSEVRSILLKENRKSASTSAQMGGNDGGRGPGGRGAESYPASATGGGRSLPLSVGSAFRPYGAHRPFAKLMPSGHFLTVGVPMSLYAVKTSAAD